MVHASHDESPDKVVKATPRRHVESRAGCKQRPALPPTSMRDRVSIMPHPCPSASYHATSYKLRPETPLHWAKTPAFRRSWHLQPRHSRLFASMRKVMFSSTASCPIRRTTTTSITEAQKQSPRCTVIPIQALQTAKPGGRRSSLGSEAQIRKRASIALQVLQPAQAEGLRRRLDDKVQTLEDALLRSQAAILIRSGAPQSSSFASLHPNRRLSFRT